MHRMQNNGTRWKNHMKRMRCTIAKFSESIALCERTAATDFNNEKDSKKKKKRRAHLGCVLFVYFVSP